MTDLFGKHLLKLVLIAIMALQPAAFSYAMTSMDPTSGHGHHQQNPSDKMGHSMHHAMHTQMEHSQMIHDHMDHSNMDHSDMAHDTQPTPETTQPGHDMTNCCDSSACCPATIAGEIIELSPSAPHYSSVAATLREGIEPSAETKPPRPLLN